MKRTIIILFTLIFSVSFCMAQQNIQTQQQIESRYQEAIASAQKHFNQQQYSEAKRYYVIARDLKPENAALINEIIAQIDKLLPAGINNNGNNSITYTPVAGLPTQNGGNIQTTNNTASGSNYQGTMVPGATLTAKLDWLDRLAESHNTYIIEVTADESIAPRTLRYRGGIDITVVLRGDNQNRTIRLSSHGTMFTVNTDVTFILDGNITLQGHKGNSGSMVYVDGGTLKMNAGTTITGNNNIRRNGNGGGVWVENGIFEMNDGTISGNTVGANGGGVYLGHPFTSKSTFIMNGGTISGNSASHGGGVYRWGGIIKMTAGTISGNVAQIGGGIWCSDFTMTGGTITSNTAHEYGGGVYSTGVFTKTGGTITGYNSDFINGNVVKDDSGVLSRRGHAVYYESNTRTLSTKGTIIPTMRKEATAGSGMNLSNGSDQNWDQYSVKPQ